VAVALPHQPGALESTMTEKHTPEKKPWQPSMDRLTELNPVVSHQDPTGALENPAPLADEDDEVEQDEPIR
jgi:hypothetical protein